MSDDPDRCRVNSLVELPDSSPVEGVVRWDPVHSLWNGAMLAGTLAAPFLFSWRALTICLLLAGATLLLGHSVGFHRRLIHRSFDCPLWLERLLVWAGTLVGMSGPLWMIRTHDLRDWAQRRTDCHDYLAHRRSPLVDAWWQMHCRLVLRFPPTFDLGRAGRDPFYRLLEATWMAQQLPVAAFLYLAGGWSGVLWGVCVRVTLSPALSRVFHGLGRAGHHSKARTMRQYMRRLVAKGGDFVRRRGARPHIEVLLVLARIRLHVGEERSSLCHGRFFTRRRWAKKRQPSGELVGMGCRCQHQPGRIVGVLRRKRLGM